MLPQWEKADQQSQLRHPTRSRDQDDETSTRLECSRLRSSGNVGMRMEKNERRRQRLSCLGGAVKHHHPIGPTRCFFGGRIEPIVTHRETGEDIHYDDFTSLYPCINKTRPYPTSHPHIETEYHATNPTEWAQVVCMTYGLIQCKVQASRGLYHPVLPIREAGMLLSHLRQRATRMCDRFRLYPHSYAERTFTGTWWSEHGRAGTRARLPSL